MSPTVIIMIPTGLNFLNSTFNRLNVHMKGTLLGCCCCLIGSTITPVHSLATLKEQSLLQQSIDGCIDVPTSFNKCWSWGEGKTEGDDGEERGEAARKEGEEVGTEEMRRLQLRAQSLPITYHSN